jgi:hypothetical protein
MNKKIAAVLMVMVGCVLAWVLSVRQPAAHPGGPQNVAAKTTSAPAVDVPTPAPAPVAAEPQAESTAKSATVDPQPKPQNQNAGNSAPPKEPIQDPAARVALSLVGADPDAENYWLGAISDPNLSNQEREDLMEDLNEDGLSDPKHPGPQDMPLIAARIRLIEEIAPYADDFMLEHLGEAHKDLSNLLAGNPAN